MKVEISTNKEELEIERNLIHKIIKELKRECNLVYLDSNDLDNLYFLRDRLDYTHNKLKHKR